MRRYLTLLILVGVGSALHAAELPPLLVRVLDHHGRPLAGASVHAAAEPEVPDLPETVIEEKTGPDGTARLSGLPDDRIVWMLAERRGYSPAFQSFSGAAEARRERRIVLEPGTLAVGRVVDEKGRPVVGAEAELTGAAFGLTPAPSLPAFLRAQPKVRTGPAGRFRFRDLPAGRYELRFRHPAFSPLVAGRPVQGGRSGDLGRFVLHRGTVLTGTVTDPDGRPVAGLALWVMGEFSHPDEPPPPTAVTGADGTFAIPGLPPDKLALYACGQRHHPETVAVHLLDEPLHLTVRPAATLRGRVLGPDGEPLAGAMLTARPAGGFSTGFQVWTPCPVHDEAVSDASGRFVVGPLAPDWYDLLANARGMKQAILPMLRTAAGEPGEEVEIRLEGGGILSGRVLDAAGAPVAGADLSLDGPWYSDTESARDGSFSFDIAFAEPSPAVLSAEKCGYEKVRRELEELAGDVEIDLVLARGGDCPTIRGRVVGPDGAPIERALVTGVYLREAWTTADGRFAMPWREGRNEISAQKPGFAMARLEVDPAVDPLDGLEIRLERGAAISGRLLGLSEEDRPTVGAWLGRPSEPTLPGTVAGDRTFRIEDVPSGTLQLYAEAGALMATRTVALEPGQAELSVDLEMPAAQTVSGQVLDDRAQPVAGATITVNVTDGRNTWSLTDSSTRADGSFALRLPDESYFLHASKDGFLQTDTDLEVRVDGRPETGLEIRLEPATTLRGHLFGLAPGDRVGILMRGPGNLMGHVELDRFTVEGLQPGEWVIEATRYDAKGTRVRRAVEIPPGITSLEVDLDFAEAEKP